MVDLVIIKNGEPVTNSLLIAEKFKKAHRRVMQTADKVISDVKEVAALNGATDDEYRITELRREINGREYKYYEMNRNMFSLLVMGFTGIDAMKWKIDFIRAFNLMEKMLLNQQQLEWKQQREQGKIARKGETDTIQKFVEYAKSQGSKGAKWYYKHFTKATYKALQLVEHKNPKLRDTLDVLELSQLMIAEDIAMKSLEENMKTGEHYKVIFVNVKNDIEKYASTLFLSNQKQLK
jgi:Rha family phage regulatory protein